jgi:hypothetical protein
LNAGKLGTTSSIVQFLAASGRRVTNFSLDSVDVSPDVITTLAAADAFRNLTTLRLYQIRCMKEEDFQLIRAQSQALEVLDLSCVGIDQAGLEQFLHDCPHLQRLGACALRRYSLPQCGYV